MLKLDGFIDIKDYEGLYAINKNGDIYSYPKLRGYIKRPLKSKILKQAIRPDGYVVVSLYKDNESKLKLVHRLVIETFKENKDNKPFVNHIDGNKQNNNIDNLEWCTCSENHLHAFKIGLKKPTNNSRNATAKATRKLTFQQAEEIRALYKKGNIFQKELAKMFGLSQFNISQIINNKTYKKEMY